MGEKVSTQHRNYPSDGGGGRKIPLSTTRTRDLVNDQLALTRATKIGEADDAIREPRPFELTRGLSTVNPTSPNTNPSRELEAGGLSYTEP